MIPHWIKVHGIDLLKKSPNQWPDVEDVPDVLLEQPKWQHQLTAEEADGVLCFWQKKGKGKGKGTGASKDDKDDEDEDEQE